MEGGLGLDSDKFTFATLIRSALLALGERDKLMLLHRVQVRGWLADAGVTDRAMLVAFSEMAADGALYRWWHDEGAPVEETTRIVASLGMESAVSRALLALVLSPANRTLEPSESAASSASLEKHDRVVQRGRRSLANPQPLPYSMTRKQVRDLYEHFVAV